MTDWGRTSPVLQHDKLSPAVFFSACFGCIVCNWLAFPKTFVSQSLGSNSLGEQVSIHGLGALLGELQVVGICTYIVGMAIDLNAQDRVLLQQIGQAIQFRR